MRISGGPKGRPKISPVIVGHETCWLAACLLVILLCPILGKLLGLFVQRVVEDVQHNTLGDGIPPAVGVVFGVCVHIHGVSATDEGVLEYHVDAVIIF